MWRDPIRKGWAACLFLGHCGIWNFSHYKKTKYRYNLFFSHYKYCYNLFFSHYKKCYKLSFAMLNFQNSGFYTRFYPIAIYPWIAPSAGFQPDLTGRDLQINSSNSSFFFFTKKDFCQFFFFAKKFFCQYSFFAKKSFWVISFFTKKDLVRFLGGLITTCLRLYLE